VSPGPQVLYTPGSQLTGSKRDHVHCHAQIGEAVSLAQRADAVVLCLGLSADLEGEQGDTSNKEAAGDKLSLDLPGLQQDLMEAVVATGKPTVLVLISGSALAVGWADENVPAVMQAWYGGDEAGTAIAEVLFGDYSPSGRLPVTFPRSLDQVPDFANYAMEGRTYRYMTEEPLYPFGYGLTYAQFDYSDLKLSSPEINQRCDLEATVTVRNTGRQSGDEVAQLYVAAEDAPFRTPRFDLRGFQRVRLDPGQSQEIKFVLRPRDLSVIDEEGRRMLMPLSFRIWVGGSQPDSRSKQLLGKEPLSTTVKISGEAVELEY
jgi:beta-glucosidase